MTTANGTIGPDRSFHYEPGRVEIIGRRLKMEYVGMASVFVVTALLIFGRLDTWTQTIAGMFGVFLLFLGLKKKTWDHFSTSFLLFGAGLIAAAPIAATGWAIPYLCFGGCIWACEGYIELRPNRIFGLPLILGGWAAHDWTWILGAVFVVFYLTHHVADRPEWRPRFKFFIFASVGVALVVSIVSRHSIATLADLTGLGSLAIEPFGLAALIAMVIATIVGLVSCWQELVMPHRLSIILFGLLAPIDVRFLALFGMVAAVILAATLFRDSIRYKKLRPLFKHAEWHFFWYVFALAIVAAIAMIPR